MDKRKLDKYIKNAILIFCVYYFWYVIIDEFMSYRVDESFSAIIFTILTIYIWNRINK